MSETTQLSVQIQFQAGVLENLFERSKRQIFMTMYWNGDQFPVLLQDMVRSFNPIFFPPRLLQQPDQLFTRHACSKVKDQ